MKYQQGTQRIEVVVRKEGGGGGGDSQTAEDSEKGRKTTWKSVLFGSESDSRMKRILKTNATHALAVSKQVVDLAIEYEISGIGIVSGDQALQDRVSRQYEMVKDTTNVISSVAMGAIYGAWGGPIGSALGMTFGAITSSISNMVKYRGREREYNFKIMKENNAIEYQRARAGINLTTGRLR